MPRSIDHVVIVVNDLAAAVQTFEHRGFTVTFGGEHEHRPSRNALIPFADGSYIELVGFRPTTEPIVDPWWTLLQIGEGFADHALLSDRVGDDVARLAAAGFTARGPIAGGRQRPDGQRVDWQIARIESAGNNRPPFILEDITPRELRIPGGEFAIHANGIDRIAGVTTVVESIATARALYDAVTGSAGETVASSVDGGSGGGGAAVRYALGAQWLELVEPTADASSLRGALEQRGSGPYEITLGGPSADETAETIHGARIRLPR